MNISSLNLKIVNAEPLGRLKEILGVLKKEEEIQDLDITVFHQILVTMNQVE